jgi:Ca2+-binding RTX toxin-like protein
VLGGKDNNTVDGCAGDDTVNGNLGDDTLTGGEGADMFHFVGTDLGNDFVMDWNIELDILGISANIIADRADLIAATEINSFGGVTTLSDGSTVTIFVLSSGDLESINIEFICI